MIWVHVDHRVKSIVGIKRSIFSEFVTGRCMFRVDQRLSVPSTGPVSTNQFHEIGAKMMVPTLCSETKPLEFAQVDVQLGNHCYIKKELTIWFIFT